MDPTEPRPSVLDDVYRQFARRVTLAGDGHLRHLLKKGPVVFEGAQGVLLDEWRGFHPYTTWSTTTFANALTLLAEAADGAAKVGVVRCYLTRHGPGPFVTEDPALRLPEPRNRDGRWQGPFRAGHLDAVALRYATEVAGDGDWPDVVAEITGAPVTIRSHGPAAADKTAPAAPSPGAHRSSLTGAAR